MKNEIVTGTPDFVELRITAEHAAVLNDLYKSKKKDRSAEIKALLDAGLIRNDPYHSERLMITRAGTAALGLFIHFGGVIQ